MNDLVFKVGDVNLKINIKNILEASSSLRNESKQDLEAIINQDYAILLNQYNYQDKIIGLVSLGLSDGSKTLIPTFYYWLIARKIIEYRFTHSVAYHNVVLELPIISDKEVWTDKKDYLQMMQKTYTNNAQRFWYKGDNFRVRNPKGGDDIEIALVRNYLLDRDNITQMKLPSLYNIGSCLIDEKEHSIYVSSYDHERMRNMPIEIEGYLYEYNNESKNTLQRI